MRRNTLEAGRSYWRLIRFIGIYSLLVMVLFQVLPGTAAVLQSHYEALEGPSRYAIIGVLAVASVTGLVHTIRSRNRLSASLPEHGSTRN